MKPISRELSRAIQREFEEILTDEHNESETYLADISELLIALGNSPEAISTVLRKVRKYGLLRRAEGETVATLKIVDAALGRFKV